MQESKLPVMKLRVEMHHFSFNAVRKIRVWEFRLRNDITAVAVKKVLVMFTLLPISYALPDSRTSDSQSPGPSFHIV
jgi:hypothetical protein